MLSITDADALKGVIDNFERVVVVFSQPATCVPCKRLAPHIKSVEEKLPTVMFVEVDIDKAQIIRDNYSIMSVPTVLLFDSGQYKGQIKGRTAVSLVKELT